MEGSVSKILSLTAVAGLLVTSTPVVLAKAPGGSGFAPGQMMHRYGSLRGTHGFSGYAPGHLMHRYGSVRAILALLAMHPDIGSCVAEWSPRFGAAVVFDLEKADVGLRRCQSISSRPHRSE
jgi:hypothetical protein